MEKVNQEIRKLFFWALGLSIGLPAGILGIVFGAVFFIIPLLVAGILLTVAGFYIMPLLWIKYGEKRGDRTLLFMILHEHIYTVESLSEQTGYDANNVRERIKRMIMSHQLTGYLFHDDLLELNTNQAQRGRAARKKPCANCGAQMVFDGIRFHCDYCGSQAEDT